MIREPDPVSGGDPARTGEPFVLGPWRVEPESGELWRDTEVVRLEPKVMAVLVELARRPGEVVSRDDLFEAVWGSGYYSQDVLWRSISILRSALGDDAKSSRFIQTLSRRGYRLVARVEQVRKAESRQPVPRKVLVPTLTAAAGLVVIAAVLLLAFRLPRDPAPAAVESSLRAVPAETAAEHHRLGLTYFQRADRADLERSIALFERAVSLDGGYAPAFAALAEAYRTKSDRYAEDLALLDRAEAFAARALALDPQLAAGHAARGSVASSRGHLESAIAAYRRAVALDPGLASALNALGRAYLTRGELEPAQTWLLQADEAGFDPLAVHNNLAELYYLAGDRRRARELWEQALAIDPRDLSALGDLALLEVIEGRPERAGALARQALSAHPTAVRPLNVSGYVALASHRKADAWRHFAESLRLSAPGRNGSAALAMAHLRWQAGEIDISLEMLEHGVDWAHYYLDGGDERWYAPLFLARSYAIRGDGAEAERWLRMAIDRGYFDHVWTARHPLFAGVAGEPWFEVALADMKERAGSQARSLQD